jgi:flagellar biosynthesis protein FlhB
MSGEKTEKPTTRKLKKAKEKGEVLKSTEITQATIFLACCLLVFASSFVVIPRLKAIIVGWPEVFSSAKAARAAVFSTGAFEDAVIGQLGPVALGVLSDAWSLILLALLSMCALLVSVALLTVGLQVRGVFSLDPMTFKPERLNPAANLKKIFSSRTIIDLAKTLTKIGVIAFIVIGTVRSAIPFWMPVTMVGIGDSVLRLLMQSLFQIGLSCLAFYIFMAALDYGHQYYEYMKQQRMTKDEVRREYKEVEGDPMLAGYRKALMRALAQEAPAAALAQAKVVITNPTHISVAIAYTVGSGTLPRVVAMGTESVAFTIRNEAKKLGIPVIESKYLARKLFAQVKAGDLIPKTTFVEVAKILAKTPSFARPEPEAGKVAAI